MKKIYFTLSLGITSFLGFSQLSIVDVNTGMAALPSYTVNVDAVSTTTSWDFDVHNDYANSVTVKMKRYLLENVSGQDVYYCFGANCYGANTNYLYVPPQSSTISSGGMLPNGQGTYGLRADFDDNSVLGTSRVLYVLYDVNNTSDSIAIEIDYVVNAVGLAKLDAKNFNLSNPMPNPAASIVNMKYTFTSTPKSASIKVYNMVGVMVKEIKIEGMDGKAQFDVSNLTDGVYFYSLIVNNKAVSTKRLIVSK